MAELNLPGKNGQAEPVSPLPALLPLCAPTERDCILLLNIKEQNCLRGKYWGCAFESSLGFK